MFSEWDIFGVGMLANELDKNDEGLRRIDISKNTSSKSIKHVVCHDNCLLFATSDDELHFYGTDNGSFGAHSLSSDYFRGSNLPYVVNYFKKNKLQIDKIYSNSHCGHLFVSICNSSDLYCFGNNSNGQLGLGNNKIVSHDKTVKQKIIAPIKHSYFTDIGEKCVHIAVGGYLTLFLTQLS
ncbi:hypothetical protein RFI_20610 [Reticulomyxa filosa]|uniref:Uncharacterized protein n=1 Tax=Reticulomyxa filosa TaxID=46433 RepID=X6MRU3_RETFI|nr:hypothetical protein RFI_20610 [Reticulomyxa filosa]|eukprot:ETO16728.1 hypothetical protein RFI_20610 [Reticulomyxa filosa]